MKLSKWLNNGNVSTEGGIPKQEEQYSNKNEKMILSSHPAYTPKRLLELKSNEVFVFGSNLAGRHSVGAARTAVNRFGAIFGQAVGMQGSSYAIPTMQGEAETIKPYVDEFIEFAKKHSDLVFYVTRIGCGIAGFKDEDIAPLFVEGFDVDNIVLPRSFVECLNSKLFMMKANIMGAIAGDTIGSVYEFNPTKSYDFKMLRDDMEYTDDSIMTIAIADWLLHDDSFTQEKLIESMTYWGRKYPYPMGGYGGGFLLWLASKEPHPYNSWGNGSAMRVSAVGYLFNTLEETLRVARISAEVSHNHPEGIKGAQATAAAVFLARTGSSKQEIVDYIETEFGYNLHRSYEEIKNTYHFESSCQETVPQSIIAFLGSKNYEDAVRLAVALGGDADTMGSITGAIAAAYYGEMSHEIYAFAKDKLPEDLKSVVNEFENRINTK